MGEIRQIIHDDLRVGSKCVLLLEIPECIRNPAAHHRLEQIDHARPIRKAEHGTHRLAIHRSGTMRNRLIEQ